MTSQELMQKYGVYPLPSEGADLLKLFPWLTLRQAENVRELWARQHKAAEQPPVEQLAPSLEEFAQLTGTENLNRYDAFLWGFYSELGRNEAVRATERLKLDAYRRRHGL